VAGVASAGAAWFISHGTTNPLQQRDAIVLGLLGVTLAVAGGALWLKATLAGFLRFWLARLCYEQQAQADRIASSVNGSPAGAARPGPGGPAGPGPTGAPAGGARRR
jgi:hypothetical protein